MEVMKKIVLIFALLMTHIFTLGVVVGLLVVLERKFVPTAKPRKVGNTNQAIVKEKLIYQ